ncbi:hypothetical protein EVJ58_g8228 [Rhodofomes roseus]|uniref:Peptidase A2 domain-containing protein n=1 Tax=Rhodofomes roseus TaxID=34475 RepID=A0A4Y9Y0B6_9APHY|nr:hypothetical protein EVJ58_g8228 [Rhodofomes roseus]
MADGASNNERLLAAARTDNEELLLEVFEEGKFDINYQDGLGNTALHYARPPLHLAMRMEDEELRTSVVESLLDAGADTTIKDKHGETAFDLLRDDDTEIRQLMRKARAQNSISNADIANDDDDDEAGSGSGSGSEDED